MPSSNKRGRRGALVCAAGFAGLLAAVPATSAAAVAPTWNCRGTVAAAKVPALNLNVEPLVANGTPLGGNRPSCANDDAGPATIALGSISAATA